MNQLDTAALLLRLALAGVLVAHGWNHLRGPGGVEGTARWFASMGLQPARLHALASAGTELAAGSALVLGLLTTASCAATVGVMTVAFATAHRTNGFFVFRPGQGWEYVGFLAVAAVVLAVLGPGTLSVDHALGLAARLDGTGGGAFAAAGGLVGAALLLVTCWRPSALLTAE